MQTWEVVEDDYLFDLLLKNSTMIKIKMQKEKNTKKSKVK